MLKSKYFVLAAVLTVIVVIMVSACVNHDLTPSIKVDCSGFQPVSFANDVMPIIDSKCAIVGEGGCHNGDNGPTLDWRVFDNFHAHAAEVKRRVTLPATHADKMPRIGSLTTEQISTLVCWVDQGALQN